VTRTQVQTSSNAPMFLKLNNEYCEFSGDRHLHRTNRSRDSRPASALKCGNVPSTHG
jgi:hypothetical protein